MSRNRQLDFGFDIPVDENYVTEFDKAMWRRNFLKKSNDLNIKCGKKKMCDYCSSSFNTKHTSCAKSYERYCNKKGILIDYKNDNMEVYFNE